MDHKLKRYKVLLYQRPEPDEFDWNEMETYGFLGTHLGTEAAATEVISEADEKGMATRMITYPMGNTARVEISTV
jgi:hypothetical protein